MSTPAHPDIASLAPGQTLPEREFHADTVHLFQYNAVLWNSHRIHFDYPYAREAEGYPALVMAGPQLGDWLHQCVTDWLGGKGRLRSVEYSNRRAAYVGDTLRSTGTVTAVDRERGEVTIAVAILNQKDEVLAPGTIVAALGG
jgi:3-methylfumaryl-CoA hydratase